MSTDTVGRRGSTSTVWTGLCVATVILYPVDHESEFTGFGTDHSSTYL